MDSSTFNPAFSPDILKEMTYGNEVLARQVVLTFKSQTESLLNEMKERVRTEANPDLGGLLHKLAGSANSIGASMFGKWCQELEKQCSEPNETGFGLETIEDLERGFRILEVELDRYLSEGEA